jgi:hypothetical protein
MQHIVAAVALEDCRVKSDVDAGCRKTYPSIA